MAIQFKLINFSNTNILNVESTIRINIEDINIIISLSPKIADTGGLITILQNDDVVVLNKEVILNEKVTGYIPSANSLKGGFVFMDENDFVVEFDISRFGYTTFMYYVFDDGVKNEE